MPTAKPGLRVIRRLDALSGRWQLSIGLKTYLKVLVSCRSTLQALIVALQDPPQGFHPGQVVCSKWHVRPLEQIQEPEPVFSHRLGLGGALLLALGKPLIFNPSAVALIPFHRP